MTYDEIYYYGILASFIVGLLSLTFTKDKKCNIQYIGCILTTTFLSGLSWFAFTVLILSEIRTRFIKD